ncbi:MAG: helix-hairpin-helix domain-containing protein [Verrucomicrobiota bacterium]|nr:helix-hairpin-helix domain-containing protein [Verrucomicrobiota bacterium]
MDSEYLDINSCTAGQLHEFTGISPDLAKDIVDYREQKGAFYHLSELLEVPKVDSNTFQAISGCEVGKLDGYLTRHNIKRIIKNKECSAFSFKDIVALITKIPTINGAIVCSDDGLPIAIDVKAGVPSDKIAAAVSMCYKQFSESVKVMNQSSLKMMTMDIENYTISVFQQQKIFLLVLHKPSQYSTKANDICSQILEEVSATADTQKILVAKFPR